MEATVRYLEGVKFNIAVRGHSVVCDQPAENQGTDAGMAPPEFLLASLASCAAYYALEYLRARSLPTADLRVRVDAGKLKQPARLGDFRIEVTTAPLEPRHEEGVLRAVKSCLIHNTLLHPPSIEVLLNVAAPAAA
jgi:putative redox protein